MAKKVRKDVKGRVLRNGETYIKDRKLYCFSYTDAFGKRGCFYSKDLAMLREKEAKYERDKLDGMDVYALSKSTLNYVFDRYIETKKELRSTTYTNYVYIYNRFVRDGFGKNLIANIKYSDVLRFYQALLVHELKMNTLETIHTVLHPTFQMAVRDDVIRTNPSDGVMTELKRTTKKNIGVRHALTLEQERKFLEFVRQDENACAWKNLYVTLFGTGCRIGEIIGLRWEDVDFEKRLININHNITYYPRIENSYKNEFRVSLPKTDAGVRTVPMIDEVYEALLAEKEYQDNGGMFCTSEIEGMSGFIFCNRYGNIHNPAAINRAIKRHVADCNAKELVSAKREKREPIILPRFSCHIARHTFCSRLCENDVNVKVIQSIMGHKDIKTTLDIYAEVSDARKQESLLKLNITGMLI